MNAWLEVLSLLKSQVNPQSYQTWLKPTRFSHTADTTLVVRVPNREFQEWIQENYSSAIQDALEKLPLGLKQVAYVFDERVEKSHSGNGEPKPKKSRLDFDS